MAVQQREYLFSVNQLNKPEQVEGTEAIGMLLMRLILLNPGSSHLHPDMGVGIERYRFALNKLDELKNVIDYQIRTFLPNFQSANVEIKEIASTKMCNIEITIDDVTYVYDSSIAPIPISLEDIKSN